MASPTENVGGLPPRTNFDNEIRRNERQTFFVMGFVFLLFFGLTFGIGVILGAPPYFTAILGVGVAGIYLAVTYSSSVSAVLAATQARPANPSVRAERLLMDRVEEMAVAAGLPVPKVYIQDSRDINAFATGLKPDASIVCVTEGALNSLDQEELEGVIGHEMSHILNRDVRLTTVTIAVVGAIALIAEIVLRVLWFGGGRGGGKKNVPPVLIIVAIALVILAPIFSRLAYFFLSRRREYLADASGARLTRNPEGLARALEKIKRDLPDDPKGSRTVAGLYIANPWHHIQANSPFATHPPIDERIKRLRGMEL
ncbi:MAG: M48 family metallopeptidase [Thermoplasmatota archaeon]